MSKFLQVAVVAAAAMVGATGTQAQTVGMVGQYHESNGVIINIPQNPPLADCLQAGLGLGGVLYKDARCHKKREPFVAQAGAFRFQKPTQGVPVVDPVITVMGQQKQGRQVPTIGGSGLAVGDPFLVPPFAFQQRKGLQVGIVLNNVTRQLDTAFTAQMPNTERATKTRFAVTTMTRVPAALTRKFSAMNWQNPGNGQNNGLIGTTGGTLMRPRFAARLAANTTPMATVGVEKARLKYTAGPRQFGGTMALLLDGVGRLYLAGPNIDPFGTVNQRPVVVTNPVGDTQIINRTRNAAGWDWTTPGSQKPGDIRGFPGALAVNVRPACNVSPPVTPPGCNEIKNFNQGIYIGPFGLANSTKHMYALTTGTVSIVRSGVRNGILQFNTQTGMGYDTVGLSPNGGVQRNVGLVAGSYTKRLDAVPTLQLNTQLLGVNLKFTPEPGATSALLGGLGLLGFLAHLAHRRRA